MVVKKGGQRESFDRYKILSGMKRACEKRPVSVLDLEDAVRSIEAWLLESGDKEVSSQVIGERVIGVLKDLDQVAYVRFASVYREFSDVGEFMETLRSLAASTPPGLQVSSRIAQRNDDDPAAKNTDNVVPLRPAPHGTAAGSAATADRDGAGPGSKLFRQKQQELRLIDRPSQDD